MTYDSNTVASNPNILGYISKGLNVPLVMTTLENLSKTGLIARLASRQTRWNTGFGTVALSVSKGSSKSRNPSWYVETRVAKAATFWRAEYSSMRVSWRVRTREESRSAQNLVENIG